jgi:hypothetical protein
MQVRSRFRSVEVRATQRSMQRNTSFRPYFRGMVSVMSVIEGRIGPAPKLPTPRKVQKKFDDLNEV